MLAVGKRKILAISPHSDDVELGCAGFLAREISAGSEVSVLVVLAKDEVQGHLGEVPARVRQVEFEQAMDVLGVPYENRTVLLSDQTKDFDLCLYPKKDMVENLDRCIAETKATTVLLPLPSFHQEHQFVYECGLSATRPTKFQSSLKEVFAYEYPAANWGVSSSFDPSRGGVYVDISNFLENKLACLSKHQSQCFRAEQSLISLEAVRQFARLRGLESGVKYAELLYLLRSSF